MKHLILILLSFTALADKSIELNGDLDIVGTDQQAETTITYEVEGTTVQICLGLSLKGGGGGGGGGGTTGTAFDADTATTPANFTISNNGKTVLYNNNFSLEGVSSNTFYNTKFSDKVYVEFINDWNNTTNQIGITWGDDRSLNRVYYRGNQRFYIIEDGVGSNVNVGWNVKSGRVLRYFIKGQQLWVGYQIIGGGSGVNGDPLGEASPLFTLPANTDLKLFARLYDVNDSITALTETSTIESDALGYTPIDD